MIVVLFGQPHSGKSTLAKKFPAYYSHIDGNQMRQIFKNQNYTREGRIQNLNRASDVATYLNHQSFHIVMSLVYPYKEARDYLNSLNENVKWIYLYYEGERGREKYHVKDFEYPYLEENILQLNTSKLSEEECIEKIKSFVYEEHTS